ncbi:hypothetical protein QN277_010408 [Acacia crassicarpa]|uniref:Uncharacterized protein n=1 Tax=Acacia crassicarpa TaxID=499986 RepID=A0AAE1JIF9_9FABA|nr:hypothetical protein QN277_010408 [Acacia crassicarpa]
MSLVDYASSSDDEAPDFVEEPQLPQDNLRAQPSASEPPPPPTQTKSGSSSDQEPKKILDLPPPSLEKLPDASLLLNSPAVSSNLMNASDHSTRVAAALAENALRKRDSNGLAPSTLRSKVPRGNLPPSRNVPDTSSGVLVPPQLKGRSNIVTEDMGKLFVKPNKPSSAH